MGILDLFKLDGKTALVTGCRRGIGRGFAQALAEAGADIVGVSATLEEDSAVGRDIAERGQSFRGWPPAGFQLTRSFPARVRIPVIALPV